MKKLLLIPLMFALMISIVSAIDVPDPKTINYTDGTAEAHDKISNDVGIFGVDFDFGNTTELWGENITVCYLLGRETSAVIVYVTINDTVTGIEIPAPITVTPDSCTYVGIPINSIYNSTRIGSQCSGCSPKQQAIFTDTSAPINNTSYLWDGATWTQQTTRDYGIIVYYNATTEIPDTIPPVINLVTPDNNTINNTFPLNITFTVTDDNAVVTCILTNNTYLFDDRTFTIGTNYLTLQTGESEVSQTFNNLNLSCYDNEPIYNNSATILLNYTIDKVLPSITPISPENESSYNNVEDHNINIQAYCYDDNIYKFNITIYFESSAVASYESYDAVNNIITINKNFDVYNITVGNYTVQHTCYDTHTRKSIPDYTITKNTSNNKIKWITPEENEFELKYSVPAKNPIQALDYGSYKSDDNTKYIFYYVMNASEGEEREFNFELESRKFPIVYVADSSYNAHFIMGNNWLDFEFDDEDAEYEITVNDNMNYEIIITTTKTNFTFMSVGELNTAELFTVFNVYAVVPQEDEYILGTCPADTVARAMLFMFFIVIAFTVIIMGFIMLNGLIGTIGSMMLIGLGVYVWYCLTFVSILMMLLGVVLMSIFIFRGAKGFR